MRVAYQDGSRRPVEVVETERESIAAQAAYARVHLDKWTERCKAESEAAKAGGEEA